MKPLKTVVTRRTALRLVGGGIAGVTAVCAGAVTEMLGAGFLSRAPQLELVGATIAAGEPQTVWPAGGAGLFDVDPDQGGVSQDPAVAIHGDMESLPEDMEV